MQITIFPEGVLVDNVTDKQFIRFGPVRQVPRDITIEAPQCDKGCCDRGGPATCGGEEAPPGDDAQGTPETPETPEERFFRLLSRLKGEGLAPPDAAKAAFMLMREF